MDPWRVWVGKPCINHGKGWTARKYGMDSTVRSTYVQYMYRTVQYSTSILQRSTYTVPYVRSTPYCTVLSREEHGDIHGCGMDTAWEVQNGIVVMGDVLRHSWTGIPDTVPRAPSCAGWSNCWRSSPRQEVVVSHDITYQDF